MLLPKKKLNDVDRLMKNIERRLQANVDRLNKLMLESVQNDYAHKRMLERNAWKSALYQVKLAYTYVKKKEKK